MTICVTSTGTDINAEVDPRFGRTRYFILVDPDTMEYRFVENTQNADLPQGAGIQAGKTVAENGAKVLITGHCGPKAHKVLSRAGIRIMQAPPKASVGDAVTAYKAGSLTALTAPNVNGHWV